MVDVNIDFYAASPMSVELSVHWIDSTDPRAAACFLPVLAIIDVEYFNLHLLFLRGWGA